MSSLCQKSHAVSARLAGLPAAPLDGPPPFLAQQDQGHSADGGHEIVLGGAGGPLGPHPVLVQDKELIDPQYLSVLSISPAVPQSMITADPPSVVTRLQDRLEGGGQGLGPLEGEGGLLSKGGGKKKRGGARFLYNAGHAGDICIGEVPQDALLIRAVLGLVPCPPKDLEDLELAPFGFNKEVHRVK